MDRTVRDLYYIGHTPFALAAGQAKEVNLEVQADSAFECTHITGSALIADDEILDVWVNLPFLLYLVDQGSARPLMSQPISMAGMCKTRLSMPRMFLPCSMISLQITNPTKFDFDHVAVILHGRKVFDLAFAP